MHSKVISKIRCYSPNQKNTALRNYNYLYYIATREGVDLELLTKKLEGSPSDNITYLNISTIVLEVTAYSVPWILQTLINFAAKSSRYLDINAYTAVFYRYLKKTLGNSATYPKCLERLSHFGTSAGK